MSYSDIEHYSTMITGCESITHGNHKSPDGRYALTVLQLHAGDAGLYAGQEGFLDHVKRGAQTLKKWFVALLDAIGAFVYRISGAQRQEEQKARELERQMEEKLKEEAEIKEKIISITTETFSAVNERARRVFEEVKESGCLSRENFVKMEMRNVKVRAGHTAIGMLVDITERPDEWVGRDVLSEIGTLSEAIGILEKDAKKSVSSWDDEVKESEEKQEIRDASFLLSKYTEVLDWYTRAYESFIRKSEEIVNKNK